ncbi:mitochondria-eating protein [Rhinolophus ferrumequinum]|uniref:mitochondria-eating protein n=1 Tax=Rhinolophus ferrumequinum TaxID=59479 RepID=UPI00140F9D5A|nr:mitochondria-eating protein [Rhinolophus ferrumequinum]
MAENLRKLVSSESLRSMLDKLELWLRDYNKNSCDQNLNVCLEFIEQVAKVQGQLFGILTATAQEGGRNDSLEVIKSRLLPWLEASFTCASLGKPVSSKAPFPQDTLDKEKQKEPGVRNWAIQQLVSELNTSPNQVNQGQDDLAETEKTLEETKDRSSMSLLAAEEEINQLRNQLKTLQAHEEARNRNSELRGSARKTLEPTRSEQRGTEPRVPDQRSLEPTRSEQRALEPRVPDQRSLEPTRSEQRALEPRVPDQRSLEPTRSEQRSWEYRSPEPRRWEQRRSERRASDKRGAEKPSAEVICNYEKQIRTLKDEIAALCAEKSALQGRFARSRSPSPASRGRSRSRSRSHSRSHSRSRSPRHSRAGSPSTAMVKIRTPSPSRARLSSAARRAALLSRFNNAYSQARLDAQCLLRRCIDEAETVQRIIYIATVEAFHIAKMAFRHFKTRVKKSLTPSYAGTNDCEDAVLDYILCHLDLYDSQSSVNDVIRAMNINPKISLPQEVDFCILSNFIQEICCIAFAMQTLEPPLDIAFGADGEVFNDSMYRRSYDSDFTAPLVFYHVWPALMENDTVIMKGEAVTKRGAFWNSMRSVSRSRSRSLSPVCLRSHIGLSTISQSRSPSPVRYGLPRF